MLGRCPLGGGIRIKGLLAGALQLAEVAHRLHAARQLGAGLRGIVHLLGVDQVLLRRHGLHPGLANLRDLFNHAAGQAQLRLSDLALSDAVALGQGQQVQQAERQQAPQFQFIGHAQMLKGEDRVGDAPGLRGTGCVGPVLRQ